MEPSSNSSLASSARQRSISFAVLVVTLSGMAAAMGVLLYVSLDAAARQGDQPQRAAAMRLAIVSLVLLCLTLILLAWALVRYLVFRARPGGHGGTQYVDAWGLAGKRLKLQRPDEDESTQQDTDQPS